MNVRMEEKPRTNKKIFPHWLSEARENSSEEKLKESKVILLICENQCDGKYTNI